jgi:hypothetical protein
MGKQLTLEPEAAIEITPAMIQAGVAFLDERDGEFSEGMLISPRSVQAFLHACLSAGGIHLKTHPALPKDQEIVAQFELSH